MIEEAINTTGREGPSEGQPSDTGTGGTAPDPQQDNQGQLIGGKFKDTDAVLKGYQELEKKLGTLSTEQQESQRRYDDLMSQINFERSRNVQQQPSTNQDMMTDEERIALRIQNVEANLQQQGANAAVRDMFWMEQDYLKQDENKDLNTDLGKSVLQAKIFHLQKTKPYLSYDKILAEAGRMAKPLLQGFIGKAKEQVSETRTEIQTADIKSGQPRGEQISTELKSEVDGSKQHVAVRTAQLENLRS